jgi:predicted nucleic acid-binding protein
VRHNLSAFDAAYVALAADLGCPLVTTDARLARAVSDHITVLVVGRG